MSLDEAKTSDVVSTVDGFTFLVDRDLDRLYEAVQLDYRSNWFGKGFTINVMGGGGSCS